MLIGKKSNLESGYVFAPYIMMTTSAQIVSNLTNSELRKSKISKIFNIDYNSSYFNPSKSIKSRYATKIINSNLYGVIGTTGPIGNPGLPGLYYKQWKRKMKIENIFIKKPSI
jgi:hypothetical protein